MDCIVLDRVSAAIGDMQKDPKAAMRKYANDAEVTAFIMAFMRLMGDHMEELGAEGEQHKRMEEEEEKQRAAAEQAAQAKPRQVESAQVQRWISDPTIRVSTTSRRLKVDGALADAVLTADGLSLY